MLLKRAILVYVEAILLMSRTYSSSSDLHLQPKVAMGTCVVLISVRIKLSFGTLLSFVVVSFDLLRVFPHYSLIKT
jgi:hypothetical protein